MPPNITTLPTKCQQTTANANVNDKKHHCQENNQDNDTADSVDAGNRVGAIDSNDTVNKAIDDVKAVNASKAAKAINIVIAVKAVKPIKNAKGDVNCYATALIHSLDVHEDAMDATFTAKNMKKATTL
jgi:hypothetical protein